MITVTRVDGITHVTGRLSRLPAIVELASVSALNKQASRVNTQAKRQVAKVYNVKQKEIAGSMYIVKARRNRKGKGGRLFSIVSAGGRPIPLIKFRMGRDKTVVPSQKGIPVRKRKPVKVRVKRASSAKAVAHAFMAKTESGHVGIFKRDGKKRLPIGERYTTSIAKMFEREGIKAADQIIAEKGRSIFEHELDHYIGRMVKK